MNISNRLILSLSLAVASAIEGCPSSASFIVPCRSSLLSKTPNNITTRLFGRRGGGGKKKETTSQKFTKSNLPEKICVVCGRPFAWRKKWERCWDEVTCCSDVLHQRRHRTIYVFIGWDKGVLCGVLYYPEWNTQTPTKLKSLRYMSTQQWICNEVYRAKTNMQSQ